MRFLLASQSPRRRELLQLLGYEFETAVSHADESRVTDPDPAQNVLHTARLKASVMADRLAAYDFSERVLLLAADTDVALDGRILGKPADAAAARRMLRRLRDRAHQVHTAFTLLDLQSGTEVSRVHTAVVTMRAYTDAEIDAYVAGGDPLDKAGAYAIQHPVFRPVARLDGCFTGVMGLSLCQLLAALQDWQIPLRAQKTAVAAAHQGYRCSLLHRFSWFS